MLTPIVDCKPRRESDTYTSTFFIFHWNRSINDSTGMGSGEWFVAPLAIHKSGQRDPKGLGTKKPWQWMPEVWRSIDVSGQQNRMMSKFLILFKNSERETFSHRGLKTERFQMFLWILRWASRSHADCIHDKSRRVCESHRRVSIAYARDTLRTMVLQRWQARC